MNPRRQNQRVSVIEAESPWAAFSASEGLQWIPHILARAATENEDLETAWSVFRERKVQKYTPVAEWLHAILRPVFSEQFADDAAYDSEFDAAEAMLGVVAEDLAITEVANFPERPVRFRNRWFGRSMWRSERHGDAVVNLVEEQAAQGAAWAPLASGLFGGSLERATNASNRYAETFHEQASRIW